MTFRRTCCGCLLLGSAILAVWPVYAVLTSPYLWRPPAGKGHLTVDASALPVSRKALGADLTLKGVSRDSDGRLRFSLSLRRHKPSGSATCVLGDSAVYAGRFASRSSSLRGAAPGPSLDSLFWVPAEAKTLAFSQQIRVLAEPADRKVEFRDVKSSSAGTSQMVDDTRITLRKVHGNVRIDYRRWQLTGESHLKQGAEVFAVEVEERGAGVLDGDSPAILTDERGTSRTSVAMLNDAWYTAKLVKEAARALPDVYDRDPESTIGLTLHLPTGMRMAERRLQYELELAAKKARLPEVRIYVWPPMHPVPERITLQMKALGEQGRPDPV